MRGLVKADGRELIFTGNIQENKPVFSELAGYKSNFEENEAIIEHKPTGIGVKFQGNLPVSRYNFYAAYNCVCPEPFVELNVAPSKKVSWYEIYTFFCKSEDDR